MRFTHKIRTMMLKISMLLGLITLLSVWLTISNLAFMSFDFYGIDGYDRAISVVSDVPTISQVKKVFQEAPLSYMDPQTKRSSDTPPTILRNFIRRQDDLDEDDVVLASHLSTQKFKNLLIQLKYWNGPASIAVYIKNEKDIDTFYSFTEKKRQQLVNVSFHLVMEKTDMQYPHNILRNVAMETIETEYFLAMDVDLIPMPEGCHDGILEIIRKNATRAKNSGNKKTLFVLPAFSLFPKENQTHAFEEMLPKTKNKVIQKANNREMSQFWLRLFPPGHASTDYDKWYNLTEDDEREMDFYDVNLNHYASLNYEPYVVGKTLGIPRYLEALRGFGWDKISFFTECYRAGYRYTVLNDYYCVHLDHPETSKEVKSRDEKRNKPIWTRFKKEYLRRKYPTVSDTIYSWISKFFVFLGIKSMGFKKLRRNLEADLREAAAEGAASPNAPVGAVGPATDVDLIEAVVCPDAHVGTVGLDAHVSSFGPEAEEEADLREAADAAEGAVGPLRDAAEGAVGPETDPDANVGAVSPVFGYSRNVKESSESTL